MSNVVQLKTKTQEAFERLKTDMRATGVGCGLPAFKSALAKVTAEKELRDAARKQLAAKWDYSQQGRALIDKGVAMVTEADGENACDEYLTAKLSKGE